MITIHVKHNLQPIDTWQEVLEKSAKAKECGSLIPLNTVLIKQYKENHCNFELRRLTSRKPAHLSGRGPRTNPFAPWDVNLQIKSVRANHTLILNKYPVEIGHMLLITNEWKPQKGWISKSDWDSVEEVSQSFNGLWFFNSSPLAGASQPHRHLQLLRRKDKNIICPREDWFNLKIKNKLNESNILAKSSAVIKNESPHLSSLFLENSYSKLSKLLNIGCPDNDEEPTQPYNLLISNKWVAMIKRTNEGKQGFSINALGFAGYLLATDESNINWLDANGPNYLLESVVI